MWTNCENSCSARQKLSKYRLTIDRVNISGTIRNFWHRAHEMNTHGNGKIIFTNQTSEVGHQVGVGK